MHKSTCVCSVSGTAWVGAGFFALLLPQQGWLCSRQPDLSDTADTLLSTSVWTLPLQEALGVLPPGCDPGLYLVSVAFPPPLSPALSEGCSTTSVPNGPSGVLTSTPPCWEWVCALFICPFLCLIGFISKVGRQREEIISFTGLMQGN